MSWHHRLSSDLRSSVLSFFLPSHTLSDPDLNMISMLVLRFIGT